MRELSYVIAAVSALVLVVAVVAWLRIQRNPRDDLSAGQGGKPDTSRLKMASRLVTVALGIGALAALLAIIGWLLRVLKIS